MADTKDKYIIEAVFRTLTGRVIRDEKGDIRRKTNFEGTAEELEAKLVELHDEYKEKYPNAFDITLEAFVYNSISTTWMNMASYYGSEERFVTH